MLLTSENLDKIQYKTKRVKLEKTDAEINVALIPVSLITAAHESDDKDDVGFRILQASVVDDNGKPVFSKVEDFEALPLCVQKEIQEAVFDYNDLNERSEKNSVTTR